MKYSVIIPTYNRAHTLPRAIDSVITQQPSQDLEILVIDDGSTDQTEALVRECYPELTYVQQRNQGPGAARNAGIVLAQGDFVAFLDSDDCWLPHKIATEQQWFEQFPQAQVVAGNGSTTVLGNLTSADTFLQRGIAFPDHSPRFFDWSFDIMRVGPTCLTSALCFRREVFSAFNHQPFDESLRFDEDWDFEFRLFNRFSVLLYPQLVCRRFIDDDGTRRHYSPSGKPKANQELYRIYSQQRAIIERYLSKNNWDGNVKARFQARHSQLNNQICSIQKMLEGTSYESFNN